MEGRGEGRREGGRERDRESGGQVERMDKGGAGGSEGEREVEWERGRDGAYWGGGSEIQRLVNVQH